MRKVLFILLPLLLVVSFALAQKNVFNYQSDFVTLPNKKETLVTYVLADDQTGKTSIIYKDGTNTEYLLLDKNFAIESKFNPGVGFAKTLFKFDYYKHIGGVVNNLGNCFIFMVRDPVIENGNNHIRMEIVDFATKKVTNKHMFTLDGGDVLLEWFTIGQKFYHITCNDKSSTFIYHIMDENGKVTRKVIPVSLEGFNKDKLKLSEYFSFSAVVDPNHQAELEASTELSKFYPFPNKLVILVSNFKEPPHIWDIDLNTLKYTIRRLDLNGFAGHGGNKEKVFTNAAIFENNIYVINNSKDMIQVGIFEFISGKLLGKIEITPNTEIPFAETPVEFQSTGRASKESKIRNNKDLIKELYRGTTGIAVARNDKGQLILTCGVFDKETRQTTGYHLGGYEIANKPTRVGGPSGMQSFTKYNPNRYFKEGRQYNYMRTVNFRVVVDNTNYKMITSSSNSSKIDKINKHLKALPDKTESIGTFIMANRYFLTYFDSETKKFNILEFE